MSYTLISSITGQIESMTTEYVDISASQLQESTDGQYILEYNQDLAQTYTMLDATTECGWSQHLQWDTVHSRYSK